MNKFRRNCAIVLLTCLCLCQSSLLWAQAMKLHGAPLMQRYTAKDFNANPQHFSIATDKAGRLFVGNSEGILRFDGTTWELIELPGKQIARDLIRAKDDKIYVASYDTFGELVTDKDGKIRFQELLSLSGLKGNDRHVGIVWEVINTEEGVYFRAEETLFFISYDRKKTQSWRMAENVRTVFPQKNVLYARVDGVGFCKFVDGKFVLEPGGEEFAKRPLPGMIDRGNWRLLVSDDGFFRADQSGLKRLPNAAGSELANSEAYEVLALSDGSFAVGTRLGELFRFGQDFTVLERLKLGSFAVAAMSVDNEGGLWVATEGDLLRLAMPSPWSFLDAHQGVQGIVNDFEWHENALWIASTSGIARIVPQQDGTSRYETKPWVDYEAYVFDSNDAGLLIGHRQGLMVLDKGSSTPRKLLDDQKELVLLFEKSRFDETLIYALAHHSILILKIVDGRWQIKKRISLAGASVDSLVESAPGEIWFSNNYAGPERWRFDTNTFEILDKKEFGKDDGLVLQKDDPQHVYRLDDKVHVVIADKGFLFDGKKFGPELAPPFTLVMRPHELYVTETAIGAYAYTSREMWFRPKGETQWQPLRMALSSAAGYGVVRLNRDGVVRMSTWSGILQYNQKEKSTIPEPLELRFEYVTAINPENNSSINLPTDSATGYVKVPAGHNLKLRFSMVSLESGVEFRYRMLQLSSEWSGWSDRDLFIRAQPPGDYVLELQAKTRSGREAETISYRYTVLPHWYEILWVRFLILLTSIAAICLLTYWFIRNRVAKYREDNLKLEKRISERTIELESLNQRLSELVIEDSLTGVSNRRALEQGLQREWFRCLDQCRPLSVLMIDVDHFKQFNDKHGHLEGDILLREIAQTLKKEHDPKRELLARFGGEEFALLLPSVNLEDAMRRAEHIRQIMVQQNKDVTVSIGVAGFVPSIQIEQSSLLRRADAALYRAKRAGRNRVESDKD
ncbi:MAG TPA: GGDEF domain-containing protein [Arenimonas sp.]|nr:GGDEF domain-containing protein [Arenimonas sp.]